MLEASTEAEYSSMASLITCGTIGLVGRQLLGQQSCFMNHMGSLHWNSHAISCFVRILSWYVTFCRSAMLVVAIPDKNTNLNISVVIGKTVYRRTTLVLKMTGGAGHLLRVLPRLVMYRLRWHRPRYDRHEIAFPSK